MAGACRPRQEHAGVAGIALDNVVARDRIARRWCILDRCDRLTGLPGTVRRPRAR